MPPVDFTKYLGGTVGKVAQPIILPSATYPGVVAAYEMLATQLNPQNPDHVAQGHGTPYIRYSYSIVGWPDDVEEEDRNHLDADGNLVPIDLARFAKRFYSDFWLTDDSKFMLHEFWASCGIENGLTEQEAMPLPQGASVLLPITQMLSTTDPNKPRLFNPKRLNSVTGTARR